MPLPTAFACCAYSPPALSMICSDPGGCLRSVKTLVRSTVEIPPPSHLPHPIESLRRGNWVKLICGASFEDAADVRNLSLVYTLAGEFDPEDCPSDCPRPCEKVCPATAILLQRVFEEGELVQNTEWGKLQGGVITERCYGCGRCFPICPYDKIRAITYVRDPSTTTKLLQRSDVDAIEIHTSGRCTDLFSELWNSLGDSLENVKLVAVSLPNVGESTLPVMNLIYAIMEPSIKCYNLWQLDGRPMSGDIGRGATKEAVDFAVHLAAARNKPHGFYQLAGGTNAFTIKSLKKQGIFQTMTIDGNSLEKSNEDKQARPEQADIGGIAYGGYARKIVGKILHKMPTQHGLPRIEDHPEYLMEAVKEALTLIGPVKGYAELKF
ncbi:uncharacterized protein LOC103995511 isoform X2 [Musa acuminata AAA Group]|uniref:4Fe-4S ferredoxin-type domain-containing protein n=1 Tax=Musa acuminata subsp. malaccensis TaxID=214687 RepID=A0A804KE76_MUSAM|nr:PREDICTED: uncharacterized protein LOC103995511 isoform X3 [Musa acuminata subsp. malaccensis]